MRNVKEELDLVSGRSAAEVTRERIWSAVEVHVHREQLAVTEAQTAVTTFVVRRRRPR